MKITFLGTGTSQGVPVIGCTHEVCLSDDPRDKRLRSSVMIEKAGTKVVIDCGPDFREQMLRTHTSKLDAIVFTHFHADHTAGLDDTRPFTQRNGALPIYARSDVMKSLEERFGYIFATTNKYWGAPELEQHTITGSPFKIKSLSFVPVEVQHGKLTIFGFRVGDFAYITDAKTIADSQKKKLKGVHTLVINALRIEPHPTHMNLDEALRFIDEVRPEKAYLTHISHRLGFHREVSKILPDNVFLAYDGLEINV